MKKTKAIEMLPITTNNLTDLYCWVNDFIEEYYFVYPENTQEHCSTMIREAFPQMRDNRIHKAITAIQVNSGLRPDDPEYTHFCPKCLIEWIHEAEAALTE